MKAKSWNGFVVIGTVLILGLLAAVTALIDPFLHYHAPLSFLEYPLKDERYQNDGIQRNYEYDALITGTSMTQNFKPSEMDALWQVTSVKTSYSGASYHELNESIRRVFSYQPDLKYVICSLDGTLLNYSAGEDAYEDYPEYLYDKNPFNDVSYLLNKEVVPKTLAVINYTRAGEKTPSRDEYSRWSHYKTYGKDAVMATMTDLPEIEEEVVLTQEDIDRITGNVTENFLATAKAHPDTEFFLFFPPYSICFWDALVQTKQLNVQLEAEKLAVECLVGAENVHVFSFADRTDIIANLDNYTDSLHYGEWINSEILQIMHAGENELTEENYQAYYDQLKIMFEEYDYQY